MSNVIVDPDFFDHWKTQMLCNALGDQNASLCVLRLWAFCHTRKADTFEHMPAEGLKAVCRWHGDAATLEAELCNARFIYRQGDAIVVHGWKEKNKSLFTSWANGKRGGRPKSTENNPNVTRGIPTGYPQVTQDGNGLQRVDKSREEKTREEEKNTPLPHLVSSTVPAGCTEAPAFTPSARGGRLTFDRRMLPLPITLDTPEFTAAWNRYLDHRIAKGTTTTEDEAKGLLSTFARYGPAEGVQIIRRTIEECGYVRPDWPKETQAKRRQQASKGVLTGDESF